MLLQPFREYRFVIFVKHSWPLQSDANCRSSSIGTAWRRLLTKNGQSPIEKSGSEPGRNTDHFTRAVIQQIKILVEVFPPLAPGILLQWLAQLVFQAVVIDKSLFGSSP